MTNIYNTWITPSSSGWWSDVPGVRGATGRCTRATHVRHHETALLAVASSSFRRSKVELIIPVKIQPGHYSGRYEHSWLFPRTSSTMFLVSFLSQSSWHFFILFSGAFHSFQLVPFMPENHVNNARLVPLASREHARRTFYCANTAGYGCRRVKITNSCDQHTI